ncbi:hypothetical protein PHLCEN_2v9651 [Hermanssonia centrifuga]|uniref:Uncharacterized protein n=1 Tax=Hermanssonia centrifuga TaxID=98765 RepID=A0A2R6NQB3_9APHY|nr:hypothetical protein PHLCEN_2v9651 [Hermanssonia centrifuga]
MIFSEATERCKAVMGVAEGSDGSSDDDAFESCALPDRFVHSPSHPTRHTHGPDLAHGVYASSRLARQYRRQVVERVPTPVSA